MNPVGTGSLGHWKLAYRYYHLGHEIRRINWPLYLNRVHWVHFIPLWIHCWIHYLAILPVLGPVKPLPWPLYPSADSSPILFLCNIYPINKDISGNPMKSAHIPWGQNTFYWWNRLFPLIMPCIDPRDLVVPNNWNFSTHPSVLQALSAVAAGVSGANLGSAPCTSSYR